MGFGLRPENSKAEVRVVRAVSRVSSLAGVQTGNWRAGAGSGHQEAELADCWGIRGKGLGVGPGWDPCREWRLGAHRWDGAFGAV